MKLYNLIILSILLIFTSCNKNDSKIHDNVTNLKVDVTDKKEINYSQLFDTCYIIPLETHENSFIGKMDKIILTDKYIIVLDGKMTKSIFVYNLEGRLHNVIKRLGEGPTEYLHPFTISLSETGEELILYDSKGLKVMFYTMDGQYNKTIKLGPDNRYTDLISVKDNLFIAGGDIGSKSKSIHVLDENFKIRNSINTSLSDDLWLVNGMKKNYLFEKSDGEGFYYNGWHTNRILNVVERQIVEDIRISYSQNSFNFKVGEPLRLGEFLDRIAAEKSYITGDQIIDGKNFMLFSIRKGMDGKLGLWDKTKNKAHFINYLVNDMDGIIPKMPSIFPFNSNSDHFITMIYPSLFNEKKEKGLPEGPYKEILEKIKVDDIDNPILFIYKFKDKI